MSFKLIDRVIQSRSTQGMTKFVLLALASHAKDDGADIYPSISTLAEECGVTRDTIYEHIDKLTTMGIARNTGQKHFWGKGHYTTVYSINLDAVSNPSTVSEESAVSKLPPRSVDSTGSTVSTPRTQTSPEPVQHSENNVNDIEANGLQDRGDSDPEVWDQAKMLAAHLHGILSNREDVDIPARWLQLWTQDFRGALSDYSLDDVLVAVTVSQLGANKNFYKRAASIVKNIDSLLERCTSSFRKAILGPDLPATRYKSPPLSPEESASLPLEFQPEDLSVV